jgi:chorismate dehydratase
MNKKIKIAIVSYMNAKPFLYGLEHSSIINDIQIFSVHPAQCAEKLLSREVDLALVPVAVIPQMKEHYIVSDYCIGALKRVESVMLYSTVPIERVTTIHLDYQSKTSNNLVYVLARHLWKISPVWIDSSAGYENEIKGTTAGVIIGDRALHLYDKFAYKYDLAAEWYTFTNSPFTFACWVANTKLSGEFITTLNKALAHGIKNIEKVVELNK